ncbi:MAG: hypothetical protein A3F11_03140 [Gammaproteobacteria bacterium RIFCSPHIGHO2_12_FULL_37_14]|nr:MAG: hypothetical protein A3F11_03140 [Gammaproteobacteria bacterium RIFCSPHIGHO2_12_FULL_37_14]
MKKNKICVISSCGGHLSEVRVLLPVYSTYDYFYVLNDKALLASDMQNKTYFITHAERNWKIFINMWEAFKIIRKERPTVLMSTGAGLIVPFSLIARFFFGIKTIYIETIAYVDRPSLTGKIMYYLADFFYYQWPGLKQFFPKGEYIGALL